MSIYICFCRALMWHIFPQKQENTHLRPNPYFLLVENNYPSDRPVQPSYPTIILQFLIWFDVWISWCNVHIFRGEASLCLLSHRVTTGDMMTHAPCSTESPNKRTRHPPRGRSAISTIRSAGQMGFVFWALSDEWIISSHLSLKTHCVQRLDCGAHQIQTWMWREGKTQAQGCCEYMRNVFREKRGGKEKWIYIGCLQRYFLGVVASLQALFQVKWQFNFITSFPLPLCPFLSLFKAHLS